MDWMAKSNVLDLKNNLKIKGTFRKAIQLRKLTILKNKGPEVILISHRQWRPLLHP